ncbi:MAG: DUF3137 domain-containing protein [bacterium]
MPSDGDFAKFFRTSLYADLLRLEGMRKEIVKKIFILFGILGCIAGAGLIFGLEYGLPIVGFFTTIVLLGIGSFLYRVIIGEYVRDFKKSVIERIIRFISADLTYWQNGCISRIQFNSSRIFTSYPDRIRGDDLVEGRIGSTKITFSEVHAERKSETIDRYGRRRRRYSTIFRGLFFIADFNKHFVGKVVVLPDTAEKLLGGFGQAIQSLNISRGELIKMDDPEFEKQFVVYADDQIEARYVLSPSLMKRIIDFKAKIGRPVFLSFVGSEVFVAIPYSHELLEPPVMQSILSFKGARRYFDDLRFICGIVEDLNLNARIWERTAV